MQFKGKLMNQSNFELDFGSFGLNLSLQNFFSGVLSLLDVRYCCNLSMYANSRKTNKTMAKKRSFGSYFSPFDPNSGRHFFFLNLALSVTRYGMLSSWTISERT